jgi:predicted dehydrogenase
MEKIRFGMIGAGAISNSHLPAIAAREDCEIVCIADTNLEQAKTRAEQYQAPRHVASYDELVAMEDIDAVVVGIPTTFHADASIKALRNGKHVLCEKPMARTLEDCDAMLRAAEEAGKVLQIGFVRRFDDDWGMMRKLALEGKAGRPCMWRRIIAGSAPGYGPWYSDARYSDGPLPESGAHDLDFLRYTFGDVKSVTAHMDHLSHTGDVLDHSLVVLYFESGDQALVQWCWSLPQGAKSGFRGMDVIGPEGSIHEGVPGDPKWSMTVSRGDGEEVFEYENRRNAETWGLGQMNDFVRCIKTGGTPRATGLDGRKCQELYHAAVKSMETGCRVDLPL